jgi:hypothetical protein
MKKWVAFSLSCLAASSLAFAKPTKAKPKISVEAAEEQAQAFLLHPPTGTLSERLIAASEMFVGRDYVFDPLGEGAGMIDADPLYRFDVFDCQTFVETVLSLQKAQDFSDFILRFAAIRYEGGKALYEKRSHLVEAQWMPRNIDIGIFTDVTAEVGKGNEKEALFEISEQNLDKGYAIFLERLQSLWPVGSYSITYLPLDWAIANVDKIPTNTVIQIVRQPRAGVPHTVTHQGIYLEKDNKKFLRNASSSPRSKKIIDRDLLGYLKFNKSYFSKNGRWPVIGINILQINDQ